MKILHTGDWHIGKLVHGIHMTEDQAYILKQLVELIHTEKPDVLLIAGDVYDRSVPPVEAVDLLDQVLSEILLKTETQIILVAGNHDSPDRLGFGSKLLRDHGLHISGNLSKAIEPIVLQDAFGPVCFYPVPYLEPALVKALYGDDAIKSHDSAMGAVMASLRAQMDDGVRNICIAHGFIMGTESLETSESERPLSIGGSEYISVEHFEGFHYVALGHLHKPQRVKKETIRYSGSLMKYSFSEATQKKSVTLIDIDGEGHVTITDKVLDPVRDLRIIKGKLENLLDPQVYVGTHVEDYIMAVVTDREELMDVVSQLRAVYPNILRMEREQFDREAGEALSSAGSEFAQKDPLDLFSEFYENVSGECFTEEKRALVGTLFEETLQKGRNS
jgi:exonuclease SbcD